MNRKATRIILVGILFCSLAGLATGCDYDDYHRGYYSGHSDGYNGYYGHRYDDRNQDRDWNRDRDHWQFHREHDDDD